ncbi:type III-A CRISPR-associated protein Cas10/Csm1 [Methermicoccus shengliensis]|uniref:type III-A CRISPR-associated protein Cas10/Csm1 n=1 Tax=Methermicoccus shengliensis TaxID=660064 RepID=UPI0005B2AFEB|nr:type III-A CRISPR-associated protein Cas10/Csm1 [Methermicoccus shengliensis]
MPDEYELVLLAALLHDVGKFWQRTGEQGAHQQLGGRFIHQYIPPQWQGCAGIISKHHDVSAYLSEGYNPLKIVITADWLSSGERKNLNNEESANVVNTPLISVFPEIRKSQSKNRDISPSEYCYPLKKLEIRYDVLFPVPKEQYPKRQLSHEYKELWSEFVREVSKIKEVSEFEVYFNTMYYILQKYTWCIPSAVWKSRPDISLFNHLTTTCAIAACLRDIELDLTYCTALYRYVSKKELTDAEKESLDDERFLLIGGDVCGIQRFIYSVVSKGAAKALRGRSLYIQLLSETIAKHVLLRLNLPITNLLYCGGGHFLILAPHSAAPKLEEIEKWIAEKLLKIHKGELYVVLGSVGLSSSDLLSKRFGSRWHELSERIAWQKRQKFSSIMNEEHYDELFGATEEGGIKDICSVCGSEAALTPDEDDPSLKKCAFCRSLEHLAKQVAEKRYMLEIPTPTDVNGAPEDSWEHTLGMFGMRYVFVDEVGTLPEGAHVYTINSTAMPTGLCSCASAGFRFLLNTGLKEMSNLAKGSQGMKKWGVLRGDVDDLGVILSEGLGDDQSISRISTMSSMMSLYFSGWVHVICESFSKENSEGDLYGIYSGGDDLFIVGSWSALPKAAGKIYDDFRAFTCNNPDITLSCGITIAPTEKYPVSRAASLAKESLDRAKQSPGKNSICFLRPMSWEVFSGGVAQLRDRLLELIKSESIDSTVSRSLLQRLYAICRMFEDERSRGGTLAAKHDDRYGRWGWMLAYVISRARSGGKKDELLEDVKALVQSNIEHAIVAVRWVEFLTRKEEVR